jgi:hypothetical protein
MCIGKEVAHSWVFGATIYYILCLQSSPIEPWSPTTSEVYTQLDNEYGYALGTSLRFTT